MLRPNQLLCFGNVTESTKKPIGEVSILVNSAWLSGVKTKLDPRLTFTPCSYMIISCGHPSLDPH